MCNYTNDYNHMSYIIEKDGIVRGVSEEFLKLSGYSKKELLNSSFLTIWNELLRISINISVINTKLESFLFTKSLEAKRVIIERQQGSDSDERKYYINELSNLRYEVNDQLLERLITDNIIGIGVFTVPDLILVKANQAYLNNFPQPFNTKEIFYGKSLKDVTPDFEGSFADKMLHKSITINKSLSFEETQTLVSSLSDRYWDCKLVPISMEDEVKYIVIMMNDVTERVINRERIRKNSEKIEQQNEELEAIIDNISEELYVIDKKGNFVDLNKVARKRHKLSKSDNFDDHIRKSKIYDLLGNEIDNNSRPSTRLSRGECIKNEIVIVYDQNKRYMCVNAQPIFDRQEKFVLGVLLCRDVTARILLEQKNKRNQEILLEAEKEKREALEKVIEMKDEFLSIISHEFRTPLNVINSAIQAMNYICKDELSDKTKSYINIIKQNTFRQLRLVNNLLDITRANAGHIKIHKKNIDLVFLTKSIVQSVYTYASQKGVSIKFLSSFKKKITGIDDEKYERILLNLLSNAIKFTPKGKSIIVKLRNARGNISIEVKDTGIGIPMDKIDTIFERFGQVDSSLSRQAEGAGIGLPLVKKFVEALGGSISVKSRENKGSAFTIIIPNKKVLDEHNEEPMADLVDNHLVQVTRVEFSDIYL